ncbi:hypothetical protein U1Q18_028072 [Sarracenia purpurea var. burkii]
MGLINEGQIGCCSVFIVFFRVHPLKVPNFRSVPWRSGYGVLMQAGAGISFQSEEFVCCFKEDGDHLGFCIPEDQFRDMFSSMDLPVWVVFRFSSRLCFGMELGPRESGMCYSGRTMIGGHAPLGKWGILSASFLLAGLLPPIR